MRKYVPDFFYCLLLLGIVAAFFLRLFWPVRQLIVTPDFGRSDAWHFSFVTKYVLAEKLKQHDLPIWISNMGGGFPLQAEGQTGTFFAPNILLYSWLDAVTAYNLSIILAVAGIGLGLYFWLRLLHHPPVSAFFAGITLSLSGIIIPQLPHITLLQSLSLMPFIMAATLLLAQNKSILLSLILALLVSQQLFAGFPQATFITMLFSGAYFLWLTRKEDTKFVDWARFALAGILAAGLSAIQWMPSLEFLAVSNARGGFANSVASYFSYPIRHLITIFDPFLLGNPKYGTYPPFTEFNGSIFWENTAFVGLIPLLLIITDTIIGKRQKQRREHVFFIIALFVSLVLAFGSQSPAYFIYSFWPFNLFRVPSRFLWVFVLSLLVLASASLSRLTSYAAKRCWVTVLIFLLVAGNIAWLWHTWNDYHAVAPAADWLRAPRAASTRPPGRVFTIGAPAAHNRTFLTHGWKDIRPYVFLRNTLAPNQNLLWDIPHADVYAGRFLYNQTLFQGMLTKEITQDQKEASISASGEKLLSIAGVTSVISAIPLSSQTLTKAAGSSEGETTITTWKNQHAVPRAYVAWDAHRATTAQTAFQILATDSFVPGESILVDTMSEMPSVGDSQTAQVSILASGDKSVRIAVRDNTAAGYLVLADTYYPGWRAYIDGKEVPIIPANIWQRAVAVGPGDHDIVFRYIPDTLYLGAIISGVTAGAMLIGVAFLRFFANAHTHPKASWPPPRRLRNHGR